jgi:hypothetical protein
MFATEVVLALVLSNPLRFEKRMLSCSYAFKIEVATTSPVVALTTLHEAKLSTGCLSLLHEPSKKRCCIPSWGGGTKKKVAIILRLAKKTPPVNHAFQPWNQ